MNGGMTGLPLLSILIAVPLVAGGLCLFLSANGARWTALIATLVDFALSIYLWQAYDPAGPQWQFVERGGLRGSITPGVGVGGLALGVVWVPPLLMAHLHRGAWGGGAE